MKKFLLSLASFLYFLAAAVAKPVDARTAEKVARNFLLNSTQKLRTSTELKLVWKSSGSGNSNPVDFYVFNMGNKGFILVSADDQALPVLAYSDDVSFDPAHIPASVQKWLDGYSAQIRYIVSRNISAGPEIAMRWSELMNGSSPAGTKSLQSVNPLVQTKWNQAPNENLQCPFDNSYNERTVTGCPATAMAQIMKFWNHPANGSGFHSYNHQSYGTLSANFGNTAYQWNSMPNILNGPDNEVSTLMYHCGVAIETDYGVAATGGSASYVIIAAAPTAQQTCENAFKTYFGYNASTIQGLRRSGYQDAAWVNLLKNELNSGRPLQYAGFGSGGGHTWVCDGYDNNNFFHMNWGWGGNSDGYFLLNALNPGSLGAGGGSGGFNSNQQALIGIQPANNGGGGTGQNFDLRLYSGLSLSTSQVWFTSPFSLTVNIGNFGSGNFSGQYGAAIFDQNNNFVDFMEVKSNMTLNANQHYQNPLTFSYPGSAALVPGNYSVALYYKTATQDWTIIGNGNYTNYAAFEVNYSAVIEPYSAFAITSTGGKLIKGQSATVNIDVTNTGSSTFFGSFRVSLSKLDGTWLQSIQVLQESTGLPTDFHYTGGLNFTGLITIEPGTYLLELAYQEQGSSNWYYAGSTNYSNPVYVIVESPSLSPDQFENNNSAANAFNLPVAFSGNSASKNTSGSNLHVGNDNDFYKIVLPAGFNYSVSARLHDSYNSGNGNTYSVDALFSYSGDGINFSENFDDIMSGNISVSNGGTLYFRVAPFFSGGTGSYLLDLNITRSPFSSSEALSVSGDDIRIFPNPAAEFIHLDLSAVSPVSGYIGISDMKGRKYLSQVLLPENRTVSLPLKGLPSGLYFLQISTEKGLLSKKFVKAE